MAKGNNFGLKTRDMGKAGQFAANAAAKDGAMSYSSAATLGDRWQSFATFAKGEGTKRLEGVTEQLVATYAQGIAARVAAGELSPAYGQNLVSAVNAVMGLATRGDWVAVSPTKDGGISARSNIRTQAPDGLDRSAVATAATAIQQAGNPHGAAVVELARDLGLRAKEASLLDAGRALREGVEHGQVTIRDGTKGGRARQVPITDDRQLSTLARAAGVQGDARSLVPADQSWKTWQGDGLRQARETLQAMGISRIHELRSAYALERYQAITQGQMPKFMGGQVSQGIDRAARLTIANELGHSRIAVTVSYLGAMR